MVVGTNVYRTTNDDDERHTMTTTLTCKHCGTTFDTSATTNTRCRRCKAVCRVPSGQRPSEVPYVLALALVCGHVTTAMGEHVAADRAGDYEWPCPECGSEYREAVGVLGALSEAECQAMSQQEAEAWLTAHSTTT